MQGQTTIKFHNMDASEALEARIHQKIEKLAEHFPGIISCHVVVDCEHHHQHKGRLYSVRINTILPGEELVVTHHPGKDPEKHDKVFAAMNSAFAAIRRQLIRHKDFEKIRSKDPEPHWHKAVVTMLVPLEDYGFLKSIDGEETYFHRHAVANEQYDNLTVGSDVRYVLAEGEGRKGPQATIVRLVS